MFAAIVRKRLRASLPKRTLGCAIQETYAAALLVRGGPRGWLVEWAADGALDNRRFLHAVAGRAWLRDFWVTPTRGGSAQKDFAFAVETPDGEVATLGGKTKALLLKTQVERRYPVVIEPIVMTGEEVQGPDGVHFVGGGSIKARIEDDIRLWRRLVGASRPHIASPAAALANVYLSLYPEASRKATPCRILVAEGEIVTAAVLDGWRLVDSVEYQMLEGQRVTAALVGQWRDFVRSGHPDAPLDPVPLVVGDGSRTDLRDGLEIWNPFAGPRVRVKGVAAPTVTRHSGASAIALGMAMQGSD